jgi:hypothetical protein
MAHLGQYGSACLVLHAYGKQGKLSLVLKDGNSVRQKSPVCGTVGDCQFTRSDCKLFTEKNDVAL